MKDQRKISKKKGFDTHVRSVEDNKFQSQSTQTYEIMTGEVLLNLPEPFFRQNAVSVRLSQNGKISPVGIPGAFIEPLTGNLHGTYEGLIPGQMVSIGFLRGDSSSPIILNKYPYQGVGNSLLAPSFITPMFLAGYMPTDVLMGHISGSKIGLYTGGGLNGALPGSIGIDAITQCKITAKTNIVLEAIVGAELKSSISKLTGITSAEVKAPLVKIDGSTSVQINGSTKNFVTHAELDTALQTYVSAVNLLFASKLDGGGTPGTATLNITAAKTLKVLTG
jgi:hypothetical protein